MAHLKEHWFAYLLGVIILVVILKDLPFSDHDKRDLFLPQKQISIVPGIYELSDSDADNLIRYGKQLIDSTSLYFGPNGIIAPITNRLNCQNCHRESGTKLYTNNFLAVASTYPKFRERSGRLESVEWRINECMQRSLNGEAIDSLSKEMRAMVAYINWTGKNVNKNTKVDGAGTKELNFLDRAANPATGAVIYATKCSSCHGKNGEGVLSFDSVGFIYPALWGEHSYAVSAGMFRLSKLASFIKHNMPLGATYTEPLLNDEEAWDVAAYINSLPHPMKMFAADWPVLQTKPADFPYGPYTDGFSQKQHKYGPFLPIKKVRDKQLAMMKK
jgi:thiosulfate dehydrogenase